MNKEVLGWILVVSLVFPKSACAQAIMEYGGVNAQSAGLGLGLGLSLAPHAQSLTGAYQSAVQAEQAVARKSAAVEQYVQMGISYEAKKDWTNAESAYHYALTVLASRDGPGNPKSVPILKHLVTAATAQEHWDDAISMQTTVVRFGKAASIHDPQTLVKDQLNLSKLLVQNRDYPKAAANLRESIALCDANPSCPQAQRDEALGFYAQVLKKIDDPTSQVSIAPPQFESSDMPILSEAKPTLVSEAKTHNPQTRKVDARRKMGTRPLGDPVLLPLDSTEPKLEPLDGK